MLPVKRTVENTKVPYRQLCMQLAVFLCRQIVLLMILDWCHQMQITLNSSGVIVSDVVLNSRNQFFSGRESSSILFFLLQDAPKAFHWTIVNTVRNSGHALLHVVFL